MAGSSTGRSIFRALLICTLIFLCGCKLLKPKHKAIKQQYIHAVINNKPENYNYRVSGIYNSANHRIVLHAADTSIEESKSLTIDIELGKDSTLAMLKFPRVFSSKTDTLPKRQVTFAGLHWDNLVDDVLYENYTYRSYSDLSITFSTFKDSLLTGNFSGSIWQKNKRARIREGRFSVRIKSI